MPAHFKVRTMIQLAETPARRSLAKEVSGRCHLHRHCLAGSAGNVVASENHAPVFPDGLGQLLICLVIGIGIGENDVEKNRSRMIGGESLEQLHVAARLESRELEGKAADLRLLAATYIR